MGINPVAHDNLGWFIDPEDHAPKDTTIDRLRGYFGDVNQTSRLSREEEDLALEVERLRSDPHARRMWVARTITEATKELRDYEERGIDPVGSS